MGPSSHRRNVSAVLGFAGVAVVLGLFVPAGARAQQEPTVVVDPATSPPGGTVTSRGEGWAVGGDLALFLDAVVPGTELATTTLTAATFELPFVVPPVQAGPHTLIACRVPNPVGGCRQLARTELVVTAPPTTGAPTVPPPPRTEPPPAPTAPTAPPVPPPTVPAVVVGATTTVLPGELGVTPTTVGGSPPAPSVPGGLQFNGTTFPTPGGFAGVELPTIENLAVTDVEVTQGLQNLANEFPLVADRPTTIRVFGTSEDPAGQGSVGAAVAGFRLEGGEEVPLGIEFSEALATFDDDLHRETHAYSPYIELPLSWTSGTVKLRVWVFAGEILAGNEADPDDNLREVTVEFQPADPVHLYYWPLYLTEGYDPDGAAVIWDPSDGFLQEHVFVARLWPIADLYAHPRYTVVGDATSDWNLDERPGEPNVALRELWEQGGHPDALHQYVGMVDPSFDPVTFFTGLAGQGGGVASWSTMGLGSGLPWYHRSGATVAHEGGHAFGLKHAPCLWEAFNAEPGEAVGGDVDPLFPGAYGWPDCSLAPTDERGYYGFDVSWQLGGASGPTILSNDATAPSAAFPLMGYRKPGWLDPFHGCYLLGVFGVGCEQEAVVPIDPSDPNGGSIPPAASGGIPAFDCHDVQHDTDLCQLAPNPSGDPTADAPPAPGGTTFEDDWIVVGVTHPGSGDGSLVRALTVPASGTAPGTDLAGGGPYVLAVLDAEGTALWARTLEVVDGAGAAHHFVERVPKLPGAARLVLLSPTGVLDELGPSGAPPSVVVTSAAVGASLAVTVEATDPDGDPVWVTAAFRPSADAAWTPVVPATGNRAFDIDVRDLAGTDAGELRVLATDGFHTVEEVVGGLVVPDQAPQVAVLSPARGQVEPAGRVLLLRAQALDNEDGVLDGAAVRWRSDRDGDLGVGARLETRALSEGPHELTVTATDSQGGVTEVVVPVQIGPTDLPSPEVRAALAAHLGLTAPVPAASSRWSTMGVVGLAVGLAAVGSTTGALAVRRRRR